MRGVEFAHERQARSLQPFQPREKIVGPVNLSGWLCERSILHQYAVAIILTLHPDDGSRCRGLPLHRPGWARAPHALGEDSDRASRAIPDLGDAPRAPPGIRQKIRGYVALDEKQLSAGRDVYRFQQRRVANLLAFTRCGIDNLELGAEKAFHEARVIAGYARCGRWRRHISVLRQYATENSAAVRYPAAGRSASRVERGVGQAVDRSRIRVRDPQRDTGGARDRKDEARPVRCPTRITDRRVHRKLDPGRESGVSVP